jgi:hypothetical protein
MAEKGASDTSGVSHLWQNLRDEIQTLNKKRSEHVTCKDLERVKEQLERVHKSVSELSDRPAGAAALTKLDIASDLADFLRLMDELWKMRQAETVYRKEILNIKHYLYDIVGGRCTPYSTSLLHKQLVQAKFTQLVAQDLKELREVYRTALSEKDEVRQHLYNII